MLDGMKKIRRSTGKTQAEVAEELDVPRSTYIAWERGINVPRTDMMSVLADYYGVTVDDLLGRAELPPNALRPRGVKSATAPLYGTIHAGENDEMWELLDDIKLMEETRDEHPHAFFLQVNGDCMDKVVRPGGYVFIDPDVVPHNGDVAAVNVNGDDATLKRFSRTATEIVLTPDSTNPEHTAKIIRQNAPDATRVRVLGTLVSVQYPSGYRY